jgi:hypothetical protein
VGFGYPNVEKSFGVSLGKFAKPRTHRHRGGYGHDGRVLFGYIAYGFPKYLRERLARNRIGGLARIDLKRIDPVVDGRRILRLIITFALLCTQMQQNRAFYTLNRVQRVYKLLYVVTVYRAYVAEAHLLKQRAGQYEVTYLFLHPLNKLTYRPADCGDFF